MAPAAVAASKVAAMSCVFDVELPEGVAELEGERLLLLLGELELAAVVRAGSTIASKACGISVRLVFSRPRAS